MLGYFDIINQYFPYMDTNGDGVVTKAEMIAFTESVSQNTELFSTSSLIARKQKELTELDKYFRKYDTNRNNRLSKKELASAAQKAGLTYGKEALDTFDEVDTNDDGEISYNELVDAIGEPKERDSYRVYTKTEKVNFLMSRFDTNKSGTLNFAEVRVFLIDLGYSNPPKSDINWIISLLDTNRDSKISWTELFNGLQ